MREDSIKSFDEILNEALLAYPSIPAFVRSNYEASAFHSKERAIRRYQICENVPSYSIARELLEKLGIYYSEKDLLVALELSKEKRIGIEKYQESMLINKCSVKTSDCFKGLGYSPAEKDSLVAERISETTKSGTQSEYIAKLIELDVNKRLLPLYEKTESEENV